MLDTPCHYTDKRPNVDGYVHISRSGVLKYAHVWAWEDANGPKPDGMEIDHLCNDRACDELTHLECVTPGENQRRRYERNPKMFCKNGHEFTPENTYNTTGVYSGWRACRQCKRDWAKRTKYVRPSRRPLVREALKGV